jgi:hypothetical protein
MARVVTTGGDEDPVAYPLERLRTERGFTDTVGGEDVVVLWAPGTASALDTPDISAGNDVGAVAACSAAMARTNGATRAGRTSNARRSVWGCGLASAAPGPALSEVWYFLCHANYHRQ